MAAVVLEGARLGSSADCERAGLPKPLALPVAPPGMHLAACLTSARRVRKRRTAASTSVRLAENSLLGSTPGRSRQLQQQAAGGRGQQAVSSRGSRCSNVPRVLLDWTFSGPYKRC